MESKHMMRNIGIGMAAGAALGLLMAPQKKTLKATAKKLASGWVDTIDAAGNFQIPGLETDMATCLRLMIEVISFNFRDFFADAGLLDAVGGLFGMSRQSTKA